MGKCVECGNESGRRKWCRHCFLQFWRGYHMALCELKKHSDIMQGLWQKATEQVGRLHKLTRKVNP